MGQLSKENIKTPPPPSDEELEGDSTTQNELMEYELELKKALIERFSHLNTSLKNDIDARSDFANKIFGLVCFWLAAVFFIILSQGFNHNGFNLSENVMIAIISGLSINVLGIFFFVANYLFPQNKKALKEKLKELDYFGIFSKFG